MTDRNTPEYTAINEILDEAEYQNEDTMLTADRIVDYLAALPRSAPAGTDADRLADLNARLSAIATLPERAGEPNDGGYSLVRRSDVLRLLG